MVKMTPRELIVALKQGYWDNEGAKEETIQKLTALVESNEYLEHLLNEIEKELKVGMKKEMQQLFLKLIYNWKYER